MTRPLLAAVGFIVVAHSYAWAQGASAVQDISRARAPTSTAKSEYLKKFEGSSVDLSTYIGSGTFYVSGYRNPYASLALFARPSYKLGTQYKLALRARFYAEEELTSPDTPNGRRFYPYDPWVWLAADNLKTFERDTIAQVLQQCRWNKAQAALRLGLTRTQLYVRMRKYGLEPTTPTQVTAVA